MELQLKDRKGVMDLMVMLGWNKATVMWADTQCAVVWVHIEDGELS